RLRRLKVTRYSPVSDDQKIPPLAVRAMILIVAMMALVAIYANIQRWRRDKIETIIVTPIGSPSPSPTPQ
ncbi:MAG TPA: hypothetical protein VGM62_03960, partial [Chthoniobacterales bacterium]